MKIFSVKGVSKVHSTTAVAQKSFGIEMTDGADALRGEFQRGTLFERIGE